MSALEKGMVDAVYRAAPGLAQSDLKEFMRCPEEFRQRSIKTAKKCQVFGTIAHEWVLEGKQDNVVIAPHGMKFNTKAGIAFKKENEDKRIISQIEAEMIRSWYSLVQNNRFLHDNMRKGDPEVSAFADMDVEGFPLAMKGRFDFLCGNKIFDLKTTLDATRYGFKGEIKKWGYDVQLVWYKKLLELNGVKDPEFYFIAASKQYPYRIAIYQLNEEDERLASLRVKEAAVRYTQCAKTNQWPDYPSWPEKI